jgi:antitoxin component of MazEF toxin-antitoxin module
MQEIYRKRVQRTGSGVSVLIPTKWVRKQFNGTINGEVKVVVDDNKIEIYPISDSVS